MLLNGFFDALRGHPKSATSLTIRFRITTLKSTLNIIYPPHQKSSCIVKVTHVRPSYANTNQTKCGCCGIGLCLFAPLLLYLYSDPWTAGPTALAIFIT